MFRWNGEEEERGQPLCPLSLQNQIKCSFPVKYIGLFVTPTPDVTSPAEGGKVTSARQNYGNATWRQWSTRSTMINNSDQQQWRQWCQRWCQSDDGWSPGRIDWWWCQNDEGRSPIHVHSSYSLAARHSFRKAGFNTSLLWDLPFAIWSLQDPYEYLL